MVTIFFAHDSDHFSPKQTILDHYTRLDSKRMTCVYKQNRSNNGSMKVSGYQNNNFHKS